MFNRWARVAVLVVAVVAAGLIGAAPGSSSVSISKSGCGALPPSIAAGPVGLTVANQGTVFVAVYLINSAGDVYAEIPSLTPGKALPLATTLAAGSYQLRCVFTDGTVRNSSAVTVTGTTTGAVSGYRPLPDLALTGPVNAYRSWVAAALPGLLAGCKCQLSSVGAAAAFADLAYSLLLFEHAFEAGVHWSLWRCRCRVRCWTRWARSGWVRWRPFGAPRWLPGPGSTCVLAG